MPWWEQPDRKPGCDGPKGKRLDVESWLPCLGLNVRDASSLAIRLVSDAGCGLRAEAAFR